jgi:DedD protein
MNDHNLDDLIIDDVAPKKNKTKSLLTIFALLIVVFIVGIILSRVLLEDNNTDSKLIEENNTEMIDPELTLQSTKKVEQKNEAIKLTEIIEEELNKPLEEPKISQEAKQEDKKPKTEVIVPQTHTPPTVSSIPTTTTPKKEVLHAVEVPKEAVSVPHETKPDTQAPVASGITYYIQVGSFSKEPSSRLLSSIKNNGFNYKLTTPNAKGIKKLLIGPYPTRPNVDTALVRVRDLINKSAFVVKK